ncbi:PH domain-containing protein [Streptacidiphilus sp. EB129]|uniref:PH domain-containing protein n=1 Tax=Streptacidiphilus sp. EB129 TaxID=3156262 RepID=UPI003513B28F
MSDPQGQNTPGRETPGTEPATSPAEGPATSPADSPTGSPASDPAEGPAGGPASDPAEGPADRPASDPAEGPAGSPAEGPASSPAEGPASEPAGSAASGPATPDAASGVRPAFADRRYRSVPGMIGGGLLLAITLWLCVDALVNGSGRAPWIGLAAMVALVPLISAFALWPVVRANQDRLIVRNPLRTLVVPWGSVESIQAALSVELRTEGKKYQLWSVPVSLRQRKRANRKAMIAKGDAAGTSSRRSEAAGPRHPVGGPGVLASRPSAGDPFGTIDPSLAWADHVVAELNELAEAGRARGAAAEPVTVTWTWAFIAPIVLGAVALVVLATT